MANIQLAFEKNNLWKSIGIFGLVLILIKLFIGQNPVIDSGYIIFVLAIFLIIFVLSLIIMMRSGQIFTLYIIFGAGIIMIIGILNYFNLYDWTSQYFIFSELQRVPFME